MLHINGLLSDSQFGISRFLGLLGCGEMIAYRRQESNGDNRKKQKAKSKNAVPRRAGMDFNLTRGK
jgi:hypothetical protein